MALVSVLNVGNTCLNVEGVRVRSWHREEGCRTHILRNKLGDFYIERVRAQRQMKPLGDKVKLWDHNATSACQYYVTQGMSKLPRLSFELDKLTLRSIGARRVDGRAVQLRFTPVR